MKGLELPKRGSGGLFFLMKWEKKLRKRGAVYKKGVKKSWYRADASQALSLSIRGQDTNRKVLG